MFCRLGVLFAITVTVLVAASPAQLAVPDVPKDIAVPPGYKRQTKLPKPDHGARGQRVKLLNHQAGLDSGGHGELP